MKRIIFSLLFLISIAYGQNIHTLTQAAKDSSTKQASTEYVDKAVGAVGLSLSTSGVFPTRKGYLIQPQISSPFESPLELINMGNTVGSTDSANYVKTAILKNAWSMISTWNMVFDSVNLKWLSPVISKPSRAMEVGLEGVTLHSVPAGLNFSDTWSIQFQARSEGVVGTTGLTSGNYNQSRTTLYFKYKSGTYTSPADPWTGGTSTADNPFIWLHSEETKGSSNNFLQSELNANVGTGGEMYFKKSRGTYNTKVTSNSDDHAGAIVFSLYDGSAYQNTARILPYADLNATSGVVPQSLAFQTSATNSAGITTRMRIWGGGNVSIGSNVDNANGIVQITGDLALESAGNALRIAEGSNGRVGQVALVAGTKAITITGLTTSSRAIVTLVSQGGTVTTTVAYAGVCTSNTLTITALTSGGTTDTTDTSTLNYFVIN